MPDYRLLWGDLHNHNAVGYARGSLERTYEIAREHLDFLAFTPHAQWHDMPLMPNDAHMKWVNGFKVLEDNWTKVQRMARESNRAGEFVSLLAYEWHSSYFGDYCLYYPGDDLPLHYFDHVDTLQDYVRGTDAMIVPHHLGYKQGWRGANWDHVDTRVSPVIEIFSEHGLSEHDRAPRPFIRHSNGPRDSRNTLHRALTRGLRAGVVASSDDHLGFPGAYGEGLAGVWVEDFSRRGVMDALWRRRSIAITGDRIALDVKLNGQWMGSELPFVRDRLVEVRAEGADEIERIDILRDNRVVYRYFPEDDYRPGRRWPAESVCRVEFGWGPWADLNMARIADWKARLSVRGGKILAATPFLQSGPFDENRRDRLTRESETAVRLELHTSRLQAYEDAATKGVVLRLAGPPEAALALELESPARKRLEWTFGELAEDNQVEFTGEFTTESLVVHRLVPPDLFRARCAFTDRGREGQTNWYYVRVTQANGQQAWSSPIWIDG